MTVRTTRISTETTGSIGSSFDDFLKEAGTCEETNAVAAKRVLAWQIEQAMAERNMTKKQMAEQLNTSRSQLDRILDPDNVRIQLDTAMKVARILGRELRIELV